ncbi:hypothetical protein F2Q68_00016572 [Brassica cretica]|uniref:Uncharacterized protein n=1 Tax=Brassica cretica TaxID=69181 RepID=A0A8S9HJI5_BRACR|nr:hypothetical protein F2Q68_00016572 [Brassica cretica]
MVKQDSFKVQSIFNILDKLKPTEESVYELKPAEVSVEELDELNDTNLELDDLSALSDTNLELDEVNDTEDVAGLAVGRNESFSDQRELIKPMNKAITIHFGFVSSQIRPSH